MDTIFDGTVYWDLLYFFMVYIPSDRYICFLLSCHFVVSSRLRVLIDFRPIASSNVLVCCECLESSRFIERQNGCSSRSSRLRHIRCCGRPAASPHAVRCHPAPGRAAS